MFNIIMYLYIIKCDVVYQIVIVYYEKKVQLIKFNTAENIFYIYISGLF